MDLPPLDRAAALRDDGDGLTAAAARADTLVLPLAGSQSLVGVGPRGVLRAQFLTPTMTNGADLIWLGRLGDAPLFAADLAEPCPVTACEWLELRRGLPLLPAADFQLLAYARALVHWHRTHRHCGACGAPTLSRRGGHERVCAACGLTAYPRTDPAVIVIVADPQRCLLGRQPQWDAGRYSAVAGFVEPGESLEAAVAREVLEETGVTIRTPRYFAGQPWPFPTSLMLGFHAEPVDDTIRLDGRELEDARWFTRADIVAGLTGGSLKLATRQSISWCLLESWFDRSGTPLAGIPGA